MCCSWPINDRPFKCRGDHALHPPGQPHSGWPRSVVSSNQAPDLDAARQRTEADHEAVNTKIENLLDNLSATNRELIDERLNQLKQRRQELQRRLEELDRLAAAQQQVQDMTDEALGFTGSLQHPR